MLEESIRAYMAARGSVFEARVFDCVDSTNTVLAALARTAFSPRRAAACISPCC